MRPYFLLLGLALPLFAVRWEPVRLAPEASVWFEPNFRQVGGRTDWTARAAGAWLFLTSNEAVFALPPKGAFDRKATNVHMRMVGGRRVKGVGEHALGGYSNYFLGKHENEWFSGVPHFGQVRYPEVYPGIDIVYYTVGRNVEYDFLVKPGADPAVIELAFDGTVRVDGSGDLVIREAFRQHRPRVFQGRREIEASYRLTERGTVKIAVAEFDPLVLLRLDPVLDFSTYLGGPGHEGIDDLVVASDGNPVLVGSTQSPASPALDPFQQPSVVSLAPIVLKMAADGRRVIFYTILGRNGWDSAAGVALDTNGHLLVAGNTQSTDFPVRNAWQPEFKGGSGDAFLTRLTADGRSIVHSSYFGGSSGEGLGGLAPDGQGNVYVAGASFSDDFPLVKPIQAKFGGATDGVLLKVDAEGKLVFSTYWGGPGGESLEAIVLRKDGMLFAAGSSQGDGFPLVDPLFGRTTPRVTYTNATFVAFDTREHSFKQSTYLGDGLTAGTHGIDLDAEGRIYLSGTLIDRQMPLKNALFTETTEGSFNGFLMCLRPDGKEVLWSTVLPALEYAAVAVDPGGGIHVAGKAGPGFALKESFHEFKGGGITNSDHGIMKLAPGGTALIYSTLLGGRNNELGGKVAPGPAGTVFFAGQTRSTDYAVRAAYQPEAGGGGDAVFVRITDPTVDQPPPFRVTPPSLTTRYVQGDPPPGPLLLTIAGLTQSVAIQSDVSWLRPAPASLAANGNVQIQPDFGRLNPGAYRGTVRIGPVGVEVAATVLAAAPTLSAVEPARIATGADDTGITLRGAGFTSRTTVQLQTVPWELSPVRFVDSATLRFTLPKSYLSAEFNHSITVQNPDSAVSMPVSLAVGRPAPSIAARGIVSAASYAGDVVSPGEMLTLFGEHFEEGMRVNFDGLLATPFYVTPGQLGVVVPTALAGSREVNVIVERDFDWRSVPVRMTVWPARPGLFTADSTGKGFAAALNQDGSVNSTANGAARGEIIVLWGTGGGVEALAHKVFIDGIEAEVLYAAGKDGLWQLNVRIPEFARKGEVVWRAGERESLEGVWIALRD